MKPTASFESDSLHLELFRVRVGLCVRTQRSGSPFEKYILPNLRWRNLLKIHPSIGKSISSPFLGTGCCIIYTCLMEPLTVIHGRACRFDFIWRFFPSMRGRSHGLCQGLLSSTGALGPVEDHRTIFCSLPFFVKGLCLYYVPCERIEVVVPCILLHVRRNILALAMRRVRLTLPLSSVYDNA